MSDQTKPIDPPSADVLTEDEQQRVSTAIEISNQQEAEARQAAMAALRAEQQAAHEADPTNVPGPIDPAMIGDSAADPQSGAIAPIPADDVLNEATDEGLVMLMAAHGVGPATSRENAIELLSKARAGEPLGNIPTKEEVLAACETILADPEDHTGKVWSNPLQAWVTPSA